MYLFTKLHLKRLQNITLAFFFVGEWGWEWYVCFLVNLIKFGTKKEVLQPFCFNYVICTIINNKMFSSSLQLYTKTKWTYLLLENVAYQFRIRKAGYGNLRLRWHQSWVDIILKLFVQLFNFMFGILLFLVF